MTQQLVQKIIATKCHVRELPKKVNSIHASDLEGRKFYAKNQNCPKNPCSVNSTWIGNELIYYVVAKRSGLRMPTCTILEVGGVLHWGSEYLPKRCILGNREREREANDLLRQICEESKEELLGLARALLLDVALLNNDRKPWNILKDDKNKLWYFDHDKSLFGDGYEPCSDSNGGDLGRIEDTSVNDFKVGDYLKCPTANRLVLGCLSDQEIREIFNELLLNNESLDAARLGCPNEWISDMLFTRLERFLLKWWQYLRDRILGDTPRCYLTHVLLKRGIR